MTVIPGSGALRAVKSYDSDVPGTFGIDAQLGPVAGVNGFRIQAGSASVDLSITRQ